MTIRRRVTIAAIPLTVLMVGWAVRGWLRDAWLADLGAALDADLFRLAGEEFPRPPLPGEPREGTALDWYTRAAAAIPRLPADWNDLYHEFVVSGLVPDGAIPTIDAAIEALDYVEGGAHTSFAGLWFDPSTGSLGPRATTAPLQDLVRLLCMDAGRLFDAGNTRQGVDRCLAAIRLSRDAATYCSTSLGRWFSLPALSLLIRLGDRLSAPEIDRVVRALSTVLSNPDAVPAFRLGSLSAQFSMRNALAEVEDDAVQWGYLHKRSPLGGSGFSISGSGVMGYLERKACMARVRGLVPDAWARLREGMELRASDPEASLRFERECQRSDNPAIVEVGCLVESARFNHEFSRARVEATILALLVIRYQKAEGRLPGSLKELLPPSVRPSPLGSRWLLRPAPKSGRPAIWLLPYYAGSNPIQTLP